ncbi:hypothetical protein EON65_06690 [archaeon]|nr:MAG: hypothetical protein EON65_06690 [archaeon]
MNELVQFSVRSPVYIGHPPAFLTSPVINIAHGFSGVLANFSMRGAFETRISCPPVNKMTDDISALSLFGILKKAVEDMESLSDTSLRRSFANTGLLDSLFEFMAYGSNVVRSAAFHVAAYVLPVMDVELVDGLAARHGLTSRNCVSFAEYLLCSTGKGMCFYSNLSSNSSQAIVPESANGTMGILSSQVKLLRAMASGRQEWYTSINSALSKILQSAPAVLSDLEAKIAKEMQLGVSETVETQALDGASTLYLLFGLMALLGYDASGIYAGAAIIYTDPEAGIDEEGIVIGVTRPVVIKESKSKDINKDQQQKLAKLWDSIALSHGEAVCVSLLSQPQTPTVLPRNLLRPALPSSLPVKFKDFLAGSVGLENIVSLVERIAGSDLMDYRPKPVPIVLTEKKELFFESEHPYADNLDTNEVIEIPGAKSLTIEFDENTMTESNCDYVQFFKDKSKSNSYGTKYSGRNGDENFPGYGGRPALVIPASSCVMYFHSDASNNDWGYKFKVSATVSTMTEPPNMPPLAHYSLLAQLKMCSFKAMQRLLSTFGTGGQPIFFNTLEKLVSCVLLPRPVSYVRQPLDSSKTELIFESSHPYEDNQDQYIPVHVPRAKKMTITFDPETRTECNCDYIVLYTDESRQSRVPDSEQYTGGKDGSSSNWPGLGGRDPLVIDGDSFVIHFHSDGSVNDWGWKMYVTADVTGGKLGLGTVVTRGHDINTASTAENCCLTLRNYALDGVILSDGTQYDQLTSFVLEKTPYVNTYFVDAGTLHSDAFKTPVPAEESKEEKSLEECKHADQDLVATNLTVRRVNLGHQDKIIMTTTVDMYDAPNGTVKESLEKDQVCCITEHQGKWLKVKILEASETPQEEFWISSADNDAMPFIFVHKFVELAQPQSDTTSNSGSLAQAQNGKTKKKVANPVYTVEESAAGIKPKLNVNPLPAHVNLLRQDGQFVITAISDYAVIASILYAADCVSQLIKHWPKEKPFTAEQFGSVNGLLTYLNMLASNMQLPDSRLLLETVVDLLLKDDSETTLSLVLSSFAFNFLANSSSSKTINSVDSHFVKRGESQDFESMHPYDHNMDQDWKFSFPGAQRLEIAFDSRCTTETNYDHLTIYDYSKNNTLYSSKITGYLAASDKHWPGVNVPRVVLEGTDKCIVNFKSDGGTNDWGFKGTVYAIFEEPAPEQLKTTGDKETVTESKDYSKLCILIIYLLTTRQNLSSVFKQSLYTVENFRSLSKYFSYADTETKSTLVDIFIVFSKELLNTCSDLQALEEKLLVFEQTMTAYAQELYAEDTNNGADLNMISPSLQAVAQLLVSIDSVAFSIRHKFASPCASANEELVFHNRAASSSVNDRFLLQQKHVKNKATIVRWDTKIESLSSSDSISVGLVLDCNTVRSSNVGANVSTGLEIGYNNKQLYFCLNETTKVVPYGIEAKDLQVGDILSVIYNSTQGLVSFLINDISLGVAVGTPLHSAAVEMDIRNLDLAFAVSMSSANDSIVASQSQKVDFGSSGSTVASGNVLEWLSPLYDVNSILTSLTQQQVPPVILGNKLLPYCNKKHKQAFNVANAELKTSQVFEKDIMFTSVQYVNLLVHELKLHAKDKFQVLDVNGKVLLDLETTKEWKFTAPLDALLLTATSKSFDDRGVRLSGSKGKGLSVGDRVHRGVDWCYGKQDGGIGNYGTVTTVIDWKGESNKGVVVKWDANDQEAKYRYDYFGAYDVKLVRGGTSQQDKLSAQGLWSTPESILKLRVTLHTAKEGEEEVNRMLDVTFFPCYKLDYCMQEPAFESFRNRLASLFVCRNRAGLTALVQYVNNFGKSKDLPRDDLLNKKYDDLVPSKDDLTKSRALKDLFEATALVMDESDIEAFNYDVVAALDMFVTEEEVDSGSSEPNFVFTGPHVDFKLEGMAEWGGMNEFDSEENARLASQQVYPKCRGFTKTGENVFSLRVGSELIPSPGEISWVLVDKNEKKNRTTLSREQSADRPVSVGNISVDLHDDEALARQIAAAGDSAEEDDANEELWEDISASAGGEDDEHEADEDEGEEEDEHDEEDEEEEEDEGPSSLFDSSSGDDSGSHEDSDSDSVRSSSPPATASSPQRTSSATPSCRKCRKLCRKHPGGTWQNGWSCDWPKHEGPNRFERDDVVYGCDTIGPCNWGICQRCWDRIHSAGAADISQVTKQLLTADASPIASQYIILQLLNVALVKSLPFIDLTKANQHPSSLASLVSQNRDLILEVVKSSPFQDTLSQTMASGGSFELRLSRVKAKRQSNNHKVDTEGRWSVFAQAFRVMHYMAPKTLRRTDRLYSTKFLGEHAQDAGGPYR